MRVTTWFTLFAPSLLLTSLACEMPTESQGKTSPGSTVCWDVLYDTCRGKATGSSGGHPGGHSPSKTLRLTIVTTGTPLAVGVNYRFEITTPDGFPSHSGAVAPNSTWTHKWGGGSDTKTGDHPIELLDVPTHCQVQGENPRTFKIWFTNKGKFQSDPVTFEVSCG